MKADVRCLPAAGLIAVASMLLQAGCVPMPVAPRGYVQTSRANLPGSRPDFIVPGETTREEVLLRLGSPDSEAKDQSWFTYASILDEGGVVLLDPSLRLGVGMIGLVERRLVIGFDAGSVVTRVGFNEVRCQLGTVDFSRWNTGGCQDLQGGEDPPAGASQAPSDGSAVSTFENMRFLVPSARSTVPAQEPLSRMFRGSLSLTDSALVMEAKSSISIDSPPLPKVHIPYDSITALRRSAGRKESVEIHTRSGFVFRIMVRFASMDTVFGPIPGEPELNRFLAEFQSRSGLALQER
jgi:hypothetical protein